LTGATKLQATAESEKAVAATVSATASSADAAASGVAATAAGTEAAADTTAAAAKVMKAHAGIPWVGIAIAGGFIATMLAVVAASKNSVPKFADGGLLYGPTLALAGEYAGASSNPEVVAPLSRLKGLLKGGEISGKVEFEIKARTLYGILKKENNLINRT
jgi:hypothetical protein